MTQESACFYGLNWPLWCISSIKCSQKFTHAQNCCHLLLLIPNRTLRHLATRFHEIIFGTASIHLADKKSGKKRFFSSHLSSLYSTSEGKMIYRVLYSLLLWLGNNSWCFYISPVFLKCSGNCRNKGNKILKRSF